MGGMAVVVLADERLKGLVPDPGWDVQGVRDFVGGVIAVCLYLAVAMVIIGILTLLPGLITNNMMERAFSWKRLLCAVMIPMTIGAATSGLSWSYLSFGSDGLEANSSYQRESGSPDWSGVDAKSESRSDDLSGLVSQLGQDIADRIGKAAGSAVSKALEAGSGLWDFLSGGDGQGNVFEKIGDGLSGLYSWLTGSGYAVIAIGYGPPLVL
ncbi:hypothetical protein BISA_1840 [Bifidobacterium saguini DSM 23967]|uniref:Uncharacterized protein n=2 Tax=Bifidobacterium saguini TaxID=762210 RepID=A0A087D6U2_9BIFI|nr:hypothetical protein BISA_1840 [Bifidobacterium saguini DSM 23967]